MYVHASSRDIESSLGRCSVPDIAGIMFNLKSNQRALFAFVSRTQQQLAYWKI